MGRPGTGWGWVAAGLVVLIVPFLATPGSAFADGKKIITRAADLPRLNFRGPKNADYLTVSPDDFAPLAAAVRDHIEGIFRDDYIADWATLKDLHTILAHLDLLEGNDRAVLEHVSVARRLERKTDEKLLGITFYSEIIAKSRKDAGSGSGDTFLQVLRYNLRETLAAMPWDEVRQAIVKDRALLELSDEHHIPPWVRTQASAQPSDGGAISLEYANELIFDRVLLRLIVPLKSEFVQALDRYASAHRTEDPASAGPVNIWRSRSVSLPAGEKLAAVVVAIWDSGVDTSVFPDRLFVNRREKVNGKDNDGNGFVGDVHGIGFRFDGSKTPELYFPIDENDKRLLQAQRARARGASDFYSGADTPEARAYRRGVEEGADSLYSDETGSRLRSHTHGTEVADIALAGNPAARLLVVRQSFRDEDGSASVQSIQWWRQFALNALAIVQYCKTHGVRVVNMSWTLSPPQWGALGIQADEADRWARECFTVVKRGLTAAIQSAPEILFVAAAGNTNQNAAFAEAIPPSLELPNLLTVGAVDQSGRATDFTSFGKTVTLYANGKSLEARIPGGELMTVSGTSLAAPQVTNLAAKLFAIDPSLKVSEVIGLIRQGASQSPDGTISLINPKRSVVLLAIQKDRKGRM